MEGVKLYRQEIKYVKYVLKIGIKYKNKTMFRFKKSKQLSDVIGNIIDT